MGNRERFCARARYLAVLAALAISVAIAPAMGDIPPDTGLGERQAAALAEIGPNLVPERPYPGLDRSDCVTMQNDGFGLVARLELDRRGLEGGVDPATAAPWARYMAEAITRLVGTGGVEGVCAWNNAGAPGIMNATAALAYAMHRYGSDWPDDVKEAIRAAAQDASWGDPGFYLANGRIANVAAELLAGEALGLTDLFDLGVTHLEAIFDRTMRHGGIEMNAPLYTAHHFPILIFLQVLGGERARTMARILLEYELLVQAHMYLPGGALGAPQSRDYSGGAADGGDRAMLPVMWLLVGDPELEPLLGDAYDFVVAAATDYAVPESIRAVFLEKDEGFDFWVYTDAQQGESRTPYAVYDMGLEGARAIPWEDVVMPGGTASMGVSFGYRLSTLLVTSGAYVRAPGGPFGILYQFQPMVGADTDDDGDLIGGSGINDDPDDFTCELYDFERLVYEATAISLWDPSARTGVVRTYQDTRVHIPDWAAMGGEALSAGAWRVGRLGDVYAAYMPLGTVAVEEVRGEAPDTWTYMRLDGRSGGIVELAMVSDRGGRRPRPRHGREGARAPGVQAGEKDRRGRRDLRRGGAGPRPHAVVLGDVDAGDAGPAPEPRLLPDDRLRLGQCDDHGRGPSPRMRHRGGAGGRGRRRPAGRRGPGGRCGPRCHRRCRGGTRRRCRSWRGRRGREGRGRVRVRRRRVTVKASSSFTAGRPSRRSRPP
jgi:hypothetical protein